MGRLLVCSLPGRQLINLADAHQPRDQAAGCPAADEAVHAGAQADADGIAGDAAVDDVKDGVVQAAQRAALEAADARAGNGGAGLRDKVAAVDVARAVWPHERLLRVPGGVGALAERGVARGHEAGKVKGAELHVGDGDIERAELGGQDLGEGGERGADGGLGSVEGRVDGGDDGGREDEDLGRLPLVADGLQARREQWEEGLDRENRLQEVGVEEVGEAGGRDGGDGRGLVV